VAGGDLDVTGLRLTNTAVDPGKWPSLRLDGQAITQFTGTLSVQAGSVFAAKLGVGTTQPQRPLQIGEDVGGLGIEPSDAKPNAGYVRFGDNSGWKLHFGRSREGGGRPNSGTTGVLMTLQDNGYLGLGNTEPQRSLQIGDDVGGLGIETDGKSPDAAYLRFGDNTGWRLNFGRSRESSNSGLNSVNHGVLMTLQDNGYLGIGIQKPEFPLDVAGAGRMRVREGTNGSAGVFLYQNKPGADRAFMGMMDDDNVGFYGNGQTAWKQPSAWGLTMDVNDGSVMVRQIAPNDSTASLTKLSLINRATGGGDFRWSLYTAAVGGGFGVNPNWFEIWCYPPAGSTNPAPGAYPRLRISPTGDTILAPDSGNVGIGTSPSNKLDVAGPAHASSFPTSSDERFKTRVRPLRDVLGKLDKINGVTFDWNATYEALGRSTGRREIGIIAQQVEAAFPELVTTWGDKEYRAVDYGRFSAVLLEAVKELKAATDALTERVEKLEQLTGGTKAIKPKRP
jgi:hypothetical protein